MIFVINKKKYLFYDWLCKVQTEQFALDLYENGHIYANNLQYFVKGDKDDFRYDSYEAINGYSKGDFKLRFSDGSNNILELEKLGFKAESIVYRNSDILKKPIYCMTTINNKNILKLKNNKYKIQLNENLKDLGDYIVLIYNKKLFIEKLLKKFEKTYKKRYKVYYKEVKYKNFEKEKNKEPFWEKTEKNEKVVFEKDSKYSYQKEYRIFFDMINDNSDHIDIYLGSLEDCATFYPFEKFKNIKFEVIKNS